MKGNMKTAYRWLQAFAALILINILSGRVYERFDLTADKRYTLSEATVSILESVRSPIFIDVLLEGSFPPEFRKLQTETRQLLEEIVSVNPLIKYNFINPGEDGTSEEVVQRLQGMGLTPASVTVEEGGKVTQEFVFPWGVAYTNEERQVRIPLLKNNLGSDTEERVNNSIRNLEYAFADALKKLTLTEKKSIAVLKGNGQPTDIEIADFLKTLGEYYRLAPFTLDSTEAHTQKTLNDLAAFDMILVAKPTERFSEKEKLVLDQFTMRGGKSLWLIDQVAIETDSLYNEKGSTVAFARDLNINDLFFRYGVRINPVLVRDLYFTQIVLASGEGTASQYDPVPWVYHPMVFSKNDHPINQNIEALRFQYANSIDTLSNTVKKTVLLHSSPLSALTGTPAEVSLSIITDPPPKESYKEAFIPLAVLLEGSFPSVFKNRILPEKLPDTREESTETAMIVIADGDLIKNQVSRGRPLELGYDKWTNSFYGNKEFLLNCVNYLLDDTGLINIRSKEIAVPFLDTEKVAAGKTRWQLVNVALPLLLLMIFAVVYHQLRRRKYSI